MQFRFPRTAIRNSVERSLQRLRTDRVEIVMLHSDGNDVGILQDTDAIATLCELRDEGKVCMSGSPRNRGGRMPGFEMGLDLVMATA
ncbi:MAG: aldo/keto reductase [Verrucomicrobiales bacterium]